MKSPFVTDLFSKIIEGEYEKSLSAGAARSALEHLESVGESIRQSQGDDVRENVLGYREVKRCLEQCLDFIENPSSVVTNIDHAIYYGYAATRLKKAEEIIDSELPDFGF